MKEKLNDLKLLILSDRRIWAVGVFIAVAVLIILVSGGGGTGGQGKRSRRQADLPGQPLGQQTDRSYEDLVQSIQQDMDKQKKEFGSLRESHDRLASDFSNFENKTTGLMTGAIESLEGLRVEIDKLHDIRSQQVNTSDVDSESVDGEGEGEETIVPWGDVKKEATILPPPPPKPKAVKLTFLSPGDAVKVKLLTGVYAPTDSTPYPVVFQLREPIRGPDGSAYDIGEARLLAAAQGSETESRALFRLTDLAFRHPDGRRTVVKVDGWVVGEDGISGMRGKLIDKLGRLIVATAGVGLAAALGDNIERQSNRILLTSPRNNSVQLGSEELEAAGFSAAVDTSNRLGRILIKRYEQLVPVVEVLSGRDAVAIFSQAVEISPCDEEECGDEEGGLLQRASLD